MFKALFSLQLSLGTFACLSASPVFAQVTSDGTVNTQVTQNDNLAEITGGETRGGNLFHSFQDFSIQTGNEAFFNNAESIANIFSRVTGGNISSIDGLIRANGSASLFLINPAGILFGENASLSIGGSFYGSTADSILFEDGEFSAVDNLQQPILTINAPIGLNFRDNPGDIVNRSVANGAGLSVNEGNNISLIGGNVNIENGGIIFAPGGRIGLGGLLKAGTVNIAENNNFNFPDDIARGNVTLTDSAIVAVFSGEGGSIGVNAGNLELTNGSRFLGGIRAETGSLDVQAGDIVINATDSVVIDGQGDRDTGIFASVRTNSIGNAGDINITTGSLNISNQAVLDAGSSGQGNAGNIELNTSSLTANNGATLFASANTQNNGGNVTIDAANDVSFTDNSSIFVFGEQGGSIQLDAKNLSITSGSSFFAGIPNDSGFPEAQSGDIVINLLEDLVIDRLNSENITFIVNNSFGTGNAGNIEISARNISTKNGANITSFSDGLGSTGNITINATGNIVFDGISSSQRGGTSNFSSEIATGTVGSIDIKAQNLTITNGATVQSLVEGEANSGDINIDVADTIRIDGAVVSTLNDGTSGFLASSISSNVSFDSIGNSGTININTQNLFLSRNGFIDASILGEGSAGNININADLITIGEEGNTGTSPSSIGSQVFGSPGSSIEEVSGGDITINTGSLFISDGGDIDVSVGSDLNNGTGRAGNIEINARDTVSVNGTGFINDVEVISGILADIARDSTGDAGNIDINTTRLLVTNGAFVSADILQGGSGNGGTINIRATDLVETSGGANIEVDVFENTSGTGGDLTIETGKLIVSDGSQISAVTLGEGNAGNLTIRADDSIELSGISEFGRGGLFASALIGSGDGGNLSVFTNELNIRSGATISVSNFPSIEGSTEPGTGEAGTLNIEASSVRLEDESRIEAATGSGNDGNITLDIADNLTLRNNSFISARAFNNANGGNLTINTDFIVAFPSNGNGNDIIASAEQGQGGNITINAESLLGIAEGAAFAGNNSNDIDASSEFSLDGTVTINTPDINPIQGATELPTNVIVPEQTTAQACQANREIAAQNGLNITGRGGILPEPGSPLDSQNIIGDSDNSNSAIPAPIETAQGKIQPARGIKVTESGQIILTAYRTNNAGDRLFETNSNCNPI